MKRLTTKKFNPLFNILPMALCVFWRALSVLPVHADDFEHAPPSFTNTAGQKVVPMDLETVHSKIVFDLRSGKASTHSVFNFAVHERGHPFFDLVPNPTRIALNGTELEPTSSSPFQTVSTPGNETQIRVLPREVEASRIHELIVDSELSNDDLSFSSKGVKLLFDFTDLDDRGFVERFLPTNFQYDRYSFTLDLEIVGATEAPKQHLFTNGREKQISPTQWSVEFPAHFNAASFFVHFTDSPLSIHSENLSLVSGRVIPVRLYSSLDADPSLVSQGVDKLHKVIPELESTYGDFAHEQLVVYMTSFDGGGMEYCGGTITGLRTLGHELTHSWFARGVMPADGNSGWIDEAIATWRDGGYASRAPNLERDPVSLANFGLFTRLTPRAAYGMGSLLLSELDFLFASDGGLKKRLRELFAEKKLDVISTPDFQKFLQDRTSIPLDSLMNRFVYGKNIKVELPGGVGNNVLSWGIEMKAPQADDILPPSRNETARFR